MPINQEKLIKLQQQKERAQIGGKVVRTVVCVISPVYILSILV